MNISERKQGDDLSTRVREQSSESDSLAGANGALNCQLMSTFQP
jgi:hypothetical protein